MLDAILDDCYLEVNVAKPVQLKDEGNAAMKECRFDDAIGAYSRAIACDVSNQQHVLFSNRSAAHMSKHEYEKALQDAVRCIELSPSWVKGYSRKGAALHALKRFDEAILAYKVCYGEAKIAFVLSNLLIFLLGFINGLIKFFFFFLHTLLYNKSGLFFSPTEPSMLAGLKAAAKMGRINLDPDAEEMENVRLFLERTNIAQVLAASVKVDGYKVFTIF